MLKYIHVALVGNPNSGKSTIFNNLTGARQHVGNYPGVTVERYEGITTYKGQRIQITDLPGTYSITPYSEEERVVRDFLLTEKPDVVINILDASNLHRNLYLTFLLKEMGVPLVLVFNMMDIAHWRGYSFDLEKFSEFLGAPIIETVGSKKEGMDAILDAVMAVAARSAEHSEIKEQGSEKEKAGNQGIIMYAENVEGVISSLSSALFSEVSSSDGLKEKGNTPAEFLKDEILRRWTAIRLLEGDPAVQERWNSPEVERLVKEAKNTLAEVASGAPEVAIISARYDVIGKLCAESARTEREVSRTASDKLDEVLTHRWWGIPIFLVMMYLLFQLTFTLGALPMEWIETGFGWLGENLNALWGESGESSLLRSLVVDGIIGGVGGVVIFLPNILLLFLGISVLEDSGYMARVAFLMDRFMHKVGLHGQSFIPMLIGFGCTVPAIMATRTLPEKRERLATMFILPLMSCGARLPIYALMIPAFFPTKWNAPMMWLLYVIGIILACIIAKIMSVTVLRGEAVPFIMELPPYHLPTFRTVGIHSLERGWLYLKKAGTVILGISILLWVCTTFPRLSSEEVARYDARRAEAEKAAEIEAQKSITAEKSVSESGENLIPADKINESGMEVLEISGNGSESETEHVAESVTKSKTETVVEDVAKSESVNAEETGPEENTEASVLEGILAEIDNEEAEAALSYSFMGRLGNVMEPALLPMGGDWKIGTALLGAIAAKEVFVAQMGIVYKLGEVDEESESLREILKKTYTPLQGFCIMLFCLISAPCMASFAVMGREAGWKWAVTQWCTLTFLAWCVAVCVYQLGMYFHWGV
ncbi:MAG: ferrous iron transport protein B [Planctomycetia bacterium]|nr:ferrous iron transport protein B [Planctomycetia bacterium]